MPALANIPNLLSLARLALAPFIFYAIIGQRHATALALFASAAVTDTLDGVLARRLGQITPAGAYLDPIADKILLCGVYLSLAVAGSVPWWLVAIIFGRDLFLLAASAFALAFTKFRELQPSVSGKASTFVQISCAIAWMTQNAIHSPALHAIAQALIWPAAAATIWSGIDYSLRGWRFVKTD